MEALSKTSVDNLAKENKQLKKKLEKIKRENRDLKKSVYDLSVRYNLSLQQAEHLHKPFDIDAVLSLEGGDTQKTSTPSSLSTTTAATNTSKEESGFQYRGWNAAGATVSSKKADSRKFYHKKTFTGHKGAVYCVRFSPSGNLFASGSFDKTVRVWDLSVQREVLCMADHDLNIVDVAWSNRSDELLSGSYDKTVRFWDVGTGKAVSSYTVSGFVQCVEFNPANNSIFFVGSTSKEYLIFDKRSNTPISATKNDSMVNTLYVARDGGFVLTGDSNGNIKTWQVGDLSRPCLVDSIKNEKSRPISHIHVSPSVHPGEEGRFLAVNSYDNVLRIYDRDDSLLGGRRDMLTLVSSLTGHRNKNWPIRSSFYLNRDFVGGGSTSTLDGLDPIDSEANGNSRERDSLGTLLLATGSADNHCYVFPLTAQGQGGEHVQQLSGPNGHTGRVYGVHFHSEAPDSPAPPSPALLTASADNTIKLWTTPKAALRPILPTPSYDL